MKAVGLFKYLPIDDEESLVDVEIPKPEPGPRDLLVRVKAIAVNPVDAKVRAPKTKIEQAPRVLGWDAAGIVEGIGSNVALFRPGDEVYYAGVITRPGCNCEFHVVDERITGRKPRSLSFEQAAAMPLTTITAWEALFERLAVRGPLQKAYGNPGTILIIGGAGGVGSIAIQLAKRVAGLRVIATASRPETSDWCKVLGADEVIDHHVPFAEEFKRIGVSEADYILCLNSTDAYIQGMAEVVAAQGKVCTIVETKGPININPFQRKSVAFCWELMFTRPMFETPDMQAQHTLLTETARLIDGGVLRHTMTRSFGPISAQTLRAAHAAIERGNTIGKLVLSGYE